MTFYDKRINSISYTFHIEPEIDRDVLISLSEDIAKIERHGNINNSSVLKFNNNVRIYVRLQGLMKILGKYGHVLPALHNFIKHINSKISIYVPNIKIIWNGLIKLVNHNIVFQIIEKIAKLKINDLKISKIFYTCKTNNSIDLEKINSYYGPPYYFCTSPSGRIVRKFKIHRCLTMKIYDNHKVSIISIAFNDLNNVISVLESSLLDD